MLLVLAGLSGCDSTTIYRSTRISDLEQQAFSEINQYRINQGLPALTWNDAAAEQARAHSNDMAAGTVPFGHQGMDQRLDAIRGKLPSMRLTVLAENVALNKGYRDPAHDAVQGWIESPGHHENIVGKFTLTGVGAAVSADGTYYFTQIFLR
jgi:uncharacterized protein YkwD